MDEHELKHWGILGMKWGVRRYQNEDGSLTPQGRERYGVGVSRNFKGVNDAGSLSDEELRKMTKRYRQQAEYYEARNQYIFQENQYKRNTAPIKKEHTFLKNVFVKPLENFMAKNTEFGMNYMVYALIGSQNPELAAQYMSSVSGMKINPKDSVDAKIEKMKKAASYYEAENSYLKNKSEAEKRKNGTYESDDDLEKRLRKEASISKSQNTITQNQRKDQDLRQDLRMAVGRMDQSCSEYIGEMFDFNPITGKRSDGRLFDYDPDTVNPTDPNSNFRQAVELFEGKKSHYGSR